MTEPQRAEIIQAEVVIVGAGLTGLSLAWNLTRLGVSQVVVLERDYPGCELYGRFSAGVRRQFGTRLEIEMTLASLPFFERLLQEPDIRADYEPVGYAFLAGEKELAGLEQSWRLQQEMGIGSVWLEASEIGAKFPYCNSKGIVAATFCAADFWLNPWQVHQWLLRKCREAGVQIYEQSPLTSIEVSQGKVQSVQCPNLKIKTGVVVNAAGARARLVHQLAGSDVPIEPSPRVKYLIAAPPELPRTMPLVTDLTTGAYVRNERGEAIVGVKPPQHLAGYEYDTSPAILDWMHQQASLRFPSLAKIVPLAPTRIITGLYDATPDGLPVAGPDPQIKGLYLAAGFNGHGVMHSPSVTQTLAELITLGQATTLDLAPLSMERFTSEKLAHSSVATLHLL